MRSKSNKHKELATYSRPNVRPATHEALIRLAEKTGLKLIDFLEKVTKIPNIISSIKNLK